MTDRFGDERRWVRGDDVLWRHSLDRIVALAPGTPCPVELSATASALWLVLAEPATAAEAAAALLTVYTGDQTTVEGDVARACGALADQGLARCHP